MLAKMSLQMLDHKMPTIYMYHGDCDDIVYIPCQLEQEDSAHGMDWRKKVSFKTVLKPMGVTRLDCELKLKKDIIKDKHYIENEDVIILNNKYSEMKISKKTGLIESFVSEEINILNSMKIKVFSDNADPWGMLFDDFNDCIGEFVLNGGVRVIESGVVRTKVQADFKWNKSYAVITYTFSENNKFFDIDVKILTNDENIMFKLCLRIILIKTNCKYLQSKICVFSNHMCYSRL